mgnify:CR=1 FL=1
METPPDRDGPFRAPELTPDAKRHKANEAGWDRVERWAAQELEEERRRGARRVRRSWIALAASSLGLAASIGLSFVERSALAWICLAVAAVIASGLTLLYNRRLAAR